jgi:HAD superfamily hydrolase (TIGR01509 family)
MVLVPKKIQAVLFDIDGTLSDTDDQMIQQVDRALMPFHLFFKRGQQKAFARWLVMAAESPGNFLYSLGDRLNLDSLFIRILDWRNCNHRYKPKKFWLMPGVDRLLNSLAAKLPLGVVSGRDECSCMAFINQFDFSRLFSVVVTSQTVRHTKPFPEPMLYAAEKLNISPENCLMVGDTSVDIRAAKLAGMQSVGVLCGFGSENELRRAGPDLILKSTADLLSVLE